MRNALGTKERLASPRAQVPISDPEAELPFEDMEDLVLVLVHMQQGRVAVGAQCSSTEISSAPSV